MNYIYTDPSGVEHELSEVSQIENILNQPYEYWLVGAGDSAVQVNDEEFLIFFKTPKGVFIMQFPDYIFPLINAEIEGTINHYVGGEPMEIPLMAVCEKDVAFEIIKCYLMKGELIEDYKWIDLP
jgi:hypothetical protein